MSGLRLGGVGAGLLAALIAGCRGEAPSSAVTRGEGPAPTAGPEAAPHAAGPSRWFPDGPGLSAQLARERRDHAAAIGHLDELLARSDLGEDDRAAAQVLRALEDLHLDRHAEAAARLSAAGAAPALAPVEAWLRATEAQAWLDAGAPDRALDLVAGLPVTPPLAETVAVIEADARARTGAREQARRDYEAFLQRHPDSPRRHEVRKKLADLLLDRQDPGPAQALLEALVLEAPLSDFGEAAQRRLDQLEDEREATGTKARSAAQRRATSLARELARVRARAGRREHGQAAREAEALLARSGLSDEQRCEASFLLASAIFGQRERARARPHFERAARQCRTAGSIDHVVKARYQAARGRYADGHPAAAAKELEALASEHSGHSYADDALVKAGEAWEEAGEADRARAAYRRAQEPPYRGDLAPEARRRLLVLAFATDRPEDGLSITTGGLAGEVSDPRERARLQYFRGRALERLGRAEEAQAAWRAAVSELPLSYPAVLALSRLREISDAEATRALAEARRDEAAPPSLDPPPGEAVVRARLFARLGLGEEAKAELEAAGIAGWPAVALLAQAGLHAAAQRELADLGVSWRRAGPSGADRAAWELAHPRPFAELVQPRETEHGVLPLLTFAVMQTESRFDPAAISWAGARGLMQLMPSTARSVASSAGLDPPDEDALLDPDQNLALGVRYLGRLLRRFGGGEAGAALAVPSYNAGTGPVERWIEERGDWPLDWFLEAIPFDETRRYTQSVLERWAVYRFMYGTGDEAARVPHLPAAVPRPPP